MFSKLQDDHPNLILEYFCHLQKHLLSISSHFPFLSYPMCSLVTATLSLQICLFWIFQVNRNIKYAVLRDGLFSTVFSSFTHVIACIRTSLFFTAKLYSLLWVCQVLLMYSSADGHLDYFYFSVLKIMLLWMFTYQIFVDICFHFWGAYPEEFLVILYLSVLNYLNTGSHEHCYSGVSTGFLWLVVSLKWFLI
jgi:hypothetical protein